MRICRVCGIEKELDDFPRDGKYRRHKCKQCKKESRSPQKSTYEQRRRWTLKHRYKITPEEYDELFWMQGGVCAICKNPPSKENGGSVETLHVDHNGTTGVVRGLLCSNCNRAVGLLKDDPIRMQRAADYIVESQALVVD